MSESYSASASKNQVVIRKREWDGIDRPDYTTVAGMNPGEARQLAAAEQTVEEMVAAARQRIETLETILAHKQGELDEMRQTVDELRKSEILKEARWRRLSARTTYGA